jgi:adenylate cyclase
MAQRYRKILYAAIIAFISIILIALVDNHNIVKSWHLQVKDVYSRTFHEQDSLQQDVVIVTIDQNSLNTLKNQYRILWPFPRIFYSYIVDYLNHCQAKSIIFDILLPQPDIDRLNTPGGSYSDSLFMDSMDWANNVVLAMQMEDSSHQTDNPFYNQKLKSTNIKVPDRLVAKHYPEATLPLEKFQKAAELPGVVNFHTDIDGICRRTPLFYEYNQTIVPFMALSSLMISENIRTITYDSLNNKIIAGDHQIPLSKAGLFNIKWYGPGGANKSFKYVSFASLLQSFRQWKTGQEPAIKPGIFKGKTVFIGATAAGLWDMKPTPFSSQTNPFPGVEIYATIHSNLLNNETVMNVEFAEVLILLFFILFLLNIAWTNWNIYYSSGLTFILILLPVLLNIFTFQKYSTHLPLISIELSLLLSLIIGNIVNYFTVDKRKRIIKNIFSRYMHPDVVEELTNNYEQIKMGGKEIEATVLFTDLQSFTKISEDLKSKQIVELLNTYFEKAEKIIFHNSGMLDKYTGDGLMAIYGAPIYSRDHALQACNSILEFQELGEINVNLNSKSIPLITRVGGASGKIVVGNIGSSNRMDYTAVGDTVNLAARLEGVNKIYGTHNLISSDTYQLIKDNYVCREVDYIRVKGRLEAVNIYNVICRRENFNAELKELLERHSEALELYRNRKFEKARHSFSAMQEIFPRDNLARVYKKRCEKLLNNPDIIDEDSIFNLKIK